jgi:hypothetical protein
LQEAGNEEEATSAGGGEPACEPGSDLILDVVPGDDMWARLAGAVEDFDFLFGKEAGWEGRGCQTFFFDRP